MVDGVTNSHNPFEIDCRRSPSVTYKNRQQYPSICPNEVLNLVWHGVRDLTLVFGHTRGSESKFIFGMGEVGRARVARVAAATYRSGKSQTEFGFRRVLFWLVQRALSQSEERRVGEEGRSRGSPY